MSDDIWRDALEEYEEQQLEIAKQLSLASSHESLRGILPVTSSAGANYVPIPEGPDYVPLPARANYVPIPEGPNNVPIPERANYVPFPAGSQQISSFHSTSTPRRDITSQSIGAGHGGALINSSNRGSERAERELLGSQVPKRHHAINSSDSMNRTQTQRDQAGVDGRLAQMRKEEEELISSAASPQGRLSQRTTISSLPSPRASNGSIGPASIGTSNTSSIGMSTRNVNQSPTSPREEVNGGSITARSGRVNGVHSRGGVSSDTGSHPVSDRTKSNSNSKLPFSLWFDALRVWPTLKAELTRGVRKGENTPPPEYFIGYGKITKNSSKSRPSSTEPAFSVHIYAIEPAKQQTIPQIFQKEMQVAFLSLTDDIVADDDETENALKTFELLIEKVKKPNDYNIHSKMHINENTIIATGGGSFFVDDIVAVLIKVKEVRPKAEAPSPSPLSLKAQRCTMSFAKCVFGASCKYSHTEEERKAAEEKLAARTEISVTSPEPIRKQFLEGVVRLECARKGGLESAKEWANTSREATPGGSLAALASAQEHLPDFLLHLAKNLKLSTSVDSTDDASCRVVLSALLLMPKTWESLQDALENGSKEKNPKSLAALELLVAAARTIEDNILSAAAYLLKLCVTAAAKLYQSKDSNVPTLFGALVEALVSRLPGSSATIDSPVMRALRVAVTRQSYKTPWLELPLVPTIHDLHLGEKWLSSNHLKGLKGTYKSKDEYLERLFRLLRADALADMSLRISSLARGIRVPDRELRQFKFIRAEGYRAKGGALQVALSFTPESKPRNNDAEKAKLLMDGSLVCIAPCGKWNDVETLQWAVVVSSPPGTLNKGIVVVEILPGTGTDAVEALRAILAAPQGAAKMAENPEYFTAARYALNRIQALGGKSNDDKPPELPFLEELVFAKANEAEGFEKHDVNIWKQGISSNELVITSKPFFHQLDEAQKKTVKQALLQRVWICQGPPGTGKTTASVAYFSALNSLPENMRSTKPVLMLAVKNHALDQFLERVIKENPGIGVIRVGGKSATESLTAINLANVRKSTEDACKMKKADKDVIDAYREKGKSHSELKDAQKNLADALTRCLNNQNVRAADFLNSLSETQLYDLVRNAPDGILTNIRIDGVDLIEAWAEQLSTFRSEVFDSSDVFFSQLQQAPSLLDLKKVEPEALENAEVTVGKKGKTSIKLPSLHDIVLKALQAWVEDIDCSDTRSMFQVQQSVVNETLMITENTASNDPPVVTVTSSDDDATDLDAILRESRAAQVLDDSDEEEEVEVEDERQRRRRSKREGRSGLLDTLGMSPLRSDTEDESVKSNKDVLSSVSFTAQPLVPAFASQLEANNVDDVNIWNLNFRGRALLLHRAANKLSRSSESAYAEALPVFREKENAEAMARAKFDATAVLSALKGRGVIGMTINGAAKYSSLLSVLKPEVVIVEEAAEIKEPLLIAALPSSARFLFMAGDHKQLPPKPAYYPFSKNDFKLNLSLFRRLIEEKVEHGRLRLQNRMHKKLADVVRAIGTYSDVDNGYDDGRRIHGLHDRAAHVSSATHGPFWKHAAYWWEHTDLESGSKDKYGYSNEPEAKRVASAVAWHMVNGVHPSRIVVLTGYAAQVALIRKLLLNPDILPNETIDEACKSLPEGVSTEGALPEGVISQTTSNTVLTTIDVKAKSASVKRPRVCTVDEFQGDEADHVILSLVRSEGEKLGFLKDSERLVVAISRARRSLLIIGNASHFCKFSRNWQVVAEHLDKFSAIGPTLPLICPRHPQSRGAVAESAIKVPIKSSERKCRLKCIDKLTCGHDCTSPFCHSDAEHAAMKCKFVMSKINPKCNHNIQAECWEFSKAFPGFPSCKMPCKKLMKCGHECPKTCHVGFDENHDQAMHSCSVIVSYRHADCGHEETLKCNIAKSSAPPLCKTPCTKSLLCGHPCQNECGEICSAGKNGGDCPLCAEIKEIDRLCKLKAREDQALKTIESAKELSNKIAESGVYETELDPSCAEYERVVEQIQRSVQKGHAIDIRIIKVYKLENSERKRQFFSAVADMHDASLDITKLFHGTSPTSAKKIHEQGFIFKRVRASPGPASHKENMLGAAVYLCPDSSKAASKEYLGGRHGALLLCDVLLGSTKIVTEADSFLDEPDRRKNERYDSVMMRRRTENRKSAVMYDEYAVYDSRLVLPKYRISVEIIDGAPKGDFGVKPREKDGVTFYDITFKDVEMKGLGNYSVEAHHFFAAQTYLIQLSKAFEHFEGKKLSKVTYCNNIKLEKRYQNAREMLGKRNLQTEERFVFHGTDEKNHDKIQIDGFKVGGVDVNVATGTVHGNGIYLGLTPDMSAQYSRGKSMLLVKVLAGRNKNSPMTIKDDLRPGGENDFAIVQGAFQSYDPKNDMLIVASPAQILPLYVIHWD